MQQTYFLGGNSCRGFFSLYAGAYEKLRQAKELHDALEAVYRPYVDFEALTAYTEKRVEEIFK